MLRPRQRSPAGRPPAPVDRPPPSRRASLRWRRRAWRHRHLVAALAVATVGWTAVAEVRPPPPATETVLVLTRERAAGTVLTAGDVEAVEAATSLTPPDALREPAEVLGGRLAVGLPAGLPLTDHVLAGPGLAAAAPAGTVVVPVRLADEMMATLLRPGDRIDLLTTAADVAGAAGAAQVVASGALVVSLHEATSGGLLATESAAALVLVALPEDVAGAVVGANAWAPLRLVIPPPEASTP